MRVALDVESVLADTNEAALQSTNKLDRDELIGQWDMSDEQWQVYIGVTDALWRHNPDVIPREEPNIREYVSKLQDEHTVDIVTGRLHVDAQVIWWLEEHGIEYHGFMSTDMPKYELPGYDVYIDDNPEMHGNCRLLLRHQPWNSAVETDGTETDRIHSLADAVDILCDS